MYLNIGAVSDQPQSAVAAVITTLIAYQSQARLEKTRFCRNVFMVLTDVLSHINLDAGRRCQRARRRRALDRRQLTALKSKRKENPEIKVKSRKDGEKKKKKRRARFLFNQEEG